MATMMQYPFVQRMFDVRFDTKRFIELVTHGGGDDFPDQRGRKFIAEHFDITIQVSILYVVLIFATRFFMKKREPFSLFIPLNLWNFILAVFSIVGTIKLSPEFWGTFFGKGLQNSYCFAYDFTKGENGYWVFLFIVSKLFEFIDTVFIVLRKRPLMFLHWYHHILTSIYAFYSHPKTPGFNRYGIYLNYTVHAFMYSYYFLRSLKINVPGFVAKFVTTLQILQFVISCAILMHIGYLVHFAGVHCDFDDGIFVFAMFMDTTYLILFINFYLKSYVLRGGKAKYQSTQLESKKID